MRRRNARVGQAGGEAVAKREKPSYLMEHLLGRQAEFSILAFYTTRQKLRENASSQFLTRQVPAICSGDVGDDSRHRRLGGLSVAKLVAKFTVFAAFCCTSFH